MEFVMLSHDEKLNLITELIRADIKDPNTIIQGVKLIEKELFKTKKLRPIKKSLKVNKLKRNKETGSYALVK